MTFRRDQNHLQISYYLTWFGASQHLGSDHLWEPKNREVFFQYLHLKEITESYLIGWFEVKLLDFAQLSL